MSRQKIIGIVIILLGVPFALFVSDRLFPVSAFVACGLSAIFFSPERIDDERVRQLKMKAIYIAMNSGIGAVLVVIGILHGAFPKLGSDVRALGAFEFLSGILLLALGLFHYWREQDAK